MSLASDLLELGLGILREVSGAVTGTLTDPTTSAAPTAVNWTLGRIASETREARAGQADVRRRVVEIDADGFTGGFVPRADMKLAFAGSTDKWAVVEAEPIAPGGTVIAWRLVATNDTNRSD
jgi:hypothetical protein